MHSSCRCPVLRFPPPSERFDSKPSCRQPLPLRVVLVRESFGRSVIIERCQNLASSQRQSAAGVLISQDVTGVLHHSSRHRKSKGCRVPQSLPYQNPACFLSVGKRVIVLWAVLARLFNVVVGHGHRIQIQNPIPCERVGLLTGMAWTTA